MMYVFCFILVVITMGMVLLQLSLMLGAPFGEYALGGEHKVLPAKMRPVSAFFVVIFLVMIVSYLQKGEILNLGLNTVFINIMIIINTLFLAYAIVGNGILTKSKKEKYLMTPLSAISFLCSAAVIILSIKKG